MELIDLPLKGLRLIQPKIFRDERGFFLQTYLETEYQSLGLPSFVQDNTSCSKKGTIRGLHYQEKPGQDKLVWCLEGEIFDVAVDIRKDSPTFGQWYSVILSNKSFSQFFIPKGFAHGFAVLSESAIVQYKVSAPYDSKMERSIRWNDPALGIEWPIRTPLLSPRDLESPLLEQVLR